MDVRTYLRAIRKSWWIVLLVTLLGGAGGYGYSAHSTPVYAAHVQFWVNVTAAESTNAQSTDQFAQSRAVSYAKLLSSELTSRKILSLGTVNLPQSRIASEITGSADINTTLINATVMDTSRARALRIAKALATTFPSVTTDLAPSSTGASAYLSVTSGPGVGSAPVLPRTRLNTILGTAVGLLIGLLIAVLRFLRDTSVRTRTDLEAIGHAPLIGDIGYDPAARKAPLVLERMARSVRAEAFRQLRTNLQFVDATGALQVILVTSSTESEGKSTTATNLALTFAETGRSVVLVGADLRRPRIADYLGVERSIGLTNVLVNEISLDDALQPWGADGMYVLASGAVPPNPSELLGSARMTDVLTELRRRFDHVVVDTPPLLPVTDAAVLSVHADGIIVVCRHGKTRRVQLAEAVRSLEAVNARIVGLVLNMRPARDPDAERAGSYHYYAETERRGLRFWRRRHTAAASPDMPEVRLPADTRRTTADTAPPVTHRVLEPVGAAQAGATEDAPTSFEATVGPPVGDDRPPALALLALERRVDRSARTGLRHSRAAQMREVADVAALSAHPDWSGRAGSADRAGAHRSRPAGDDRPERRRESREPDYSSGRA